MRRPAKKLKIPYGPSAERDASIRKVIRSIPRGFVSTYSKVAAAAGYPRYHRLVVRLLRLEGDRLPWQRVVGAGGYIRLKGAGALEQRQRLEMEGVTFAGRRINMEKHEIRLRTWELD